MFTIILAVLGGMILGGLIGFGGFYFGYKDVKHVNETKKKLKECKKENIQLKDDAEEFEKQNEVLKEEMFILKDENIEFKDVIADLEKYAKRMRLGKEKLDELIQIIGEFDEDIEERVNNILGEDEDQLEEGEEIEEQIEDEKIQEVKKKFF